MRLQAVSVSLGLVGLVLLTRWWLSAEPPPAEGEVVQPELASHTTKVVEPASPAKPEQPKVVKRPSAPAAPWRAQLNKLNLNIPPCSSPALRRPKIDNATVWFGGAGLYLGSRKVVGATCSPTPCDPQAARLGAQVVAVDPEGLGAPTAEGPRLIPRLKVTRGREALLVLDASTSIEAVLQLKATAAEFGAVPALSCLSSDGLASLWPLDAPRSPNLKAQPQPGEQVPTDTEGLTVEIRRDDWTVVIQREGGGYLRRPLRAKDPKLVASWASKVAGAGERATHLLVAAAPQVPWREVVSVVDAALSPCDGEACERSSLRLRAWTLITLRRGEGAGEVDPPSPPAQVTGRPPGLQAPALPRKMPMGVDGPALRGHRLNLDLKAPIPGAMRRP